MWYYAYRVQNNVSPYCLRYDKMVGAGAVMLLVSATAYLTPILQPTLETHFATEEAVQRVQGLILNTGSALIGAAAIVTSLVLFAMQVNIERMPHGLFRRLSGDSKLLGAFAGAFVLAIGVAALSTVAEPAKLAVVLVSAGWAILFIMGLFLYAYRRALGLINPLRQLGMLLDDTRKDLRRSAGRAERVVPLLEGEKGTEAASSPKDPTPDLARTRFFQINPHWTAGAKKSVQHAMSFARRYAEQGDHEVAGDALTAVVEINAAYIEAKGKTFYTNNILFEDPRASDPFITDTLECIRQNVDRAIARRDEQQIEQSLQAIGELVSLYLSIDYASPHAEKHHAHLAARYLTTAVQAVAPHEMADVLMKGQRLVGQAAQHFVASGSVNDVAGLSEKIANIAFTGCAKESYRPVTMEGVRQLAKLTFDLLHSQSHDIGYAVDKVRENISLIAKLVLKVPDTPLEDRHGTILAPYYSPIGMQSLRVRLTGLVDAVSAVEPDNANAQSVIRNFERWADGLHRTTKELLLEAIAVSSGFTNHMIQWIQGVTEILLVASNAPACDPHRKKELRSHALLLIGTLNWIPENQESVTFVETFQITETLFNAAIDASSRDCHENSKNIGLDLLSWAFKGGRYMTGWGVLERGVCGCAALALMEKAGAVDTLRSKIRQHLQSDRAPASDVLVHAAHGIRDRAGCILEPRYSSSRIDHEMSKLDHKTLAPLLEEIADMLSAEAQ